VSDADTDEEPVSGLDHLTLTTADFAARAAFYDAALGGLGLVRISELVDEEEDEPEVEAAGWGVPDGPAILWLVSGPRPTTGVHLRLRTKSRVQVETFHQDAVRTGGVSHTAPRRWTLYRRGEFSAMVADPDGNLIEAVAAE
jgi:catechol 2,3-dioxygenase-like lactoylglutathione lyase family enzyme